MSVPSEAKPSESTAASQMPPSYQPSAAATNQVIVLSVGDSGEVIRTTSAILTKRESEFARVLAGNTSEPIAALEPGRFFVACEPKWVRLLLHFLSYDCLQDLAREEREVLLQEARRFRMPSLELYLLAILGPAPPCYRFDERFLGNHAKLIMGGLIMKNDVADYSTCRLSPAVTLGEVASVTFDLRSGTRALLGYIDATVPFATGQAGSSYNSPKANLVYGVGGSLWQAGKATTPQQAFATDNRVRVEIDLRSANPAERTATWFVCDQCAGPPVTGLPESVQFAADCLSASVGIVSAERRRA